MNRCYVTFIQIVDICNGQSVRDGRVAEHTLRRVYMWYAVQVETGREETVREYFHRLVDRSVYNEIFVIRFNRMKKFYGKWHKESSVMFPGYIFIDTDTPEPAYEELKKVPVFTSLLGRDKQYFVPIERSKEELFRSMVDDNHEIAISTGLIEGDKVIITDGPLAGKEAMIKKINRHKRIAILNVTMFGESVGVTVGLEIVEKR